MKEGENAMKTPHAISIINTKSLKATPKFDGQVMVNIDVKFPRIVVPRRIIQSLIINQRINRFARDFYNFAQTELYREAIDHYRRSQQNNFPFFQFEAVQNFEITYNREPFLSMYFDQYTFRGGAHGETQRFGFTFNTSTGRQMELNQFFRSQGYLREVHQEIIRQIRRQVAQNPGIYFPDYERNVIRYFNEENYYLTRTGFAFFYPAYTIAPGATGIPVFIVPYRLLRPYMRYSL